MREEVQSWSDMPQAGRQLMGFLAIGLGTAVIAAWIAVSYFAIDVPGSLVWPGDDGFCEAATEGLGRHCFGDIALHLSVGTSLTPDDPGLVQYISNLPPGNRVLLWVFQMIGVIAGMRTALAIYVTLSSLALLVPALWAVRGKAWSQKAVVLLLASVATVPFLAVLDRGNTIAFAVPLLLTFVVAIFRGRDPVAIVAIVLAAQIKPQFGFLVLSFFVLRRVRSGLLAIGLGVGVFLLSFLVFAIPGAGSGPVSEFKRFVLYSQTRSSYLPLGADYPVNISYQKVIYEVINELAGSALTPSTIQILVLMLLALASVLLIWRGRTLPFALWLSVILMSSALVVSVTFIYYYSLVLVVAAFLLREADAGGETTQHPVLRQLLIAATVMSLTPLLIPGGRTEAPVPTTGDGVVVSLVPYLASALWLTLLVAVAIRMLLPMRRITVEEGIL